jgi:tetratricopeptide (TPR) repeat protein
MLYLVSLSHELALKDFEKALRFLPVDDVYHRQLAFFQAGLIQMKFFNKSKKAKKLFQAGIKLDPNSSLAREIAGRTDLQ